jgi:hypothetical protein
VQGKQKAKGKNSGENDAEQKARRKIDGEKDMAINIKYSDWKPSQRSRCRCTQRKEKQ